MTADRLVGLSAVLARTLHCCVFNWCNEHAMTASWLMTDNSTVECRRRPPTKCHQQQQQQQKPMCARTATHSFNDYCVLEVEGDCVPLLYTHGYKQSNLFALHRYWWWWCIGRCAAPAWCSPAMSLCCTSLVLTSQYHVLVLHRPAVSGHKMSEYWVNLGGNLSWVVQLGGLATVSPVWYCRCAISLWTAGMTMSGSKPRPVPHSKPHEKLHLCEIYACGDGLLVHI